MIRHVVCFKLLTPTHEACEAAKNVLLSMDGKVPQLRAIEVGVDFLHAGRSFDLLLSVLLDDRAALDAYQNDPYHCGVVKKHMHAVTEKSISVDYET